MAPQGAAAHSSALGCVAGCHRLSCLNHSGRWVWAGSPAVHPVWDRRGPEQQSRPLRLRLGASSETRARVGMVRGWSSPRAHIRGAGTGRPAYSVLLPSQGLGIFPQACWPRGELLFHVSC